MFKQPSANVSIRNLDVDATPDIVSPVVDAYGNTLAVVDVAVKYDASKLLPNTPLAATERFLYGEVVPTPTRPLDVTVNNVVVANAPVVGPSMFKSERFDAEDVAATVRIPFVGVVVPMPALPAIRIPSAAPLALPKLSLLAAKREINESGTVIVPPIATGEAN
jgi:hypothetical protein